MIGMGLGVFLCQQWQWKHGIAHVSDHDRLLGVYLFRQIYEMPGGFLSSTNARRKAKANDATNLR